MFKLMSAKWLLVSALACAACAMMSASAQTQEEADAYFAAKDWQNAGTAFRHLVQEDGTSARNWFKLAWADHNLENYEAARDAYISALDAGYAAEPQARYHLARVYMSLGDEAAAMEQVLKFGELGAPGGRVLSTTAEFKPLEGNAQYDQIVKLLTPCSADEYRQFDFWLGKWDVSATGSAAVIAQSKITSDQDGCVVMENYTAGGYTGVSINLYDSTTKKWHQTWMSNSAGAVYLEGGLNEDGAMELTDAELPVSKLTGAVNRVIWTPNPDGTVRQHWEQSTDGGAQWATLFDGTYTAKPPEDGGA